MVEEKTLPLKHGGFVLDMCLDHYGRRMATCSEDGVVKMFRRNNGEKGWEEIAETAPTGQAINKLSWSHPEFSMLLACSTDDSVMIVEEETETKLKFVPLAKVKPTISSLEFGPKHMGLRLAVATTDGHVQVFSPTDAARREWIARYSFNLSAEDSDKHTPCCVSWNSFPFDAPSMAIAKGTHAFLWRMDTERKKWRQISSQIIHNGTINHIAWAPNMGRSFHMIATASSDGTARIWKVQKPNPIAESDSVLGDDQVEVSLMQELKHPSSDGSLCEVFRVEWNLTATMLSTSGDDSIVRLWSPNLEGIWSHQGDLRMDDA